MRRHGILFVGLIFLLGACGEEKKSTQETQTPKVAKAEEVPTNAAHPEKASAKWEEIADGSEPFFARLAELEGPVRKEISDESGELNIKENCVQVIRPAEPKEGLIGSVEFLPQACEAPIVVGKKVPAFILMLRRSAQAEQKAEGELLEGDYELVLPTDEGDGLAVGTIRFEGDSAVISELCPGAEGDAVCTLSIEDGRFDGLEPDQKAIAKRAEAEAQAQLSDLERARKEALAAQQDLNQISERLDGIISQMDRHEKTMAQREAERETQRAALEKEVEEHRAHLKEAEQRVAAFERKVGELEVRLESKTENAEANQEALNQAKDQLQAAQDQLKKVQERLVQAESDVEQAAKTEVKNTAKVEVDVQEVKPEKASEDVKTPAEEEPKEKE